MPQVIERNMKSDLYELNDMVTDILLEINGEINVDILFYIKLILCELIINGVKHGNCNNSDKNIYVKLIIDNDFFDITVQDQGDGFVYSKNSNPCEFIECGRGLLLVEGLTDFFVVKNNAVICRKYF